MGELTSKIHIRDATGRITMRIRISGVRRWKFRQMIALRLIKLAILVSPIVTKVEID
ncbi:hypothetical protein O4H52_07955 [Sphingomonadaceae bacterium G21617-S1]|nr:hypothetical protein [Sphingomonadaceae bacterium G21617-S1]